MYREAVRKKLRAELRRRNSKLIIPHLVTLALSYLIYNETAILLPYGIILLSLLFRYIFINSRPDWKFAYMGTVCVTGLGWGWVFYLSYMIFGLMSVPTLYTLGLIITMMSGGVTAFSASRKVSIGFIISLAVIPVVVLIQDPHDSIYVLGLLIIGGALYQCYHAVLSYRYITESLSRNQTLQDFIDAIPGHVAIIDSDRKFSMVNKNLGDFFVNIIGKDVRSFLPKSDISQSLIDFIESSETYTVREVKVERNNDVSWYMVSMKRIRNPDERIVVSILPMTELVKAKEDLKIQEARSQYAAKLASLGEMSAGIAHEVNNPLTIIEGAASLMKVLLKDPVLDMPALEKSTVKIIATSQRIAKIVKSLRTLAGDAEEEPFRNVSFESIVEPCVEISKARFDSHEIKLEIRNDSRNIEIFGNEIQLSQVMMNLVSNAIDAVKDLDGEKWIKINYRTSPEWLDIYVSDNGKGVPDEIKSRIMDPFFTTKDVSQGTGLGLSISRSIIENHNGTLTLMEDSSFTTFRIRFPRMITYDESKRNAPAEESYAAQK